MSYNSTLFKSSFASNPFGSPMDGRAFSGTKYRFGFNTQEKVDEISGDGNHNTALFWEYDTRLGRRWNLDPEYKKFPQHSHYSCFSNNPITMVDPKGDADFYNAKGSWIGTDGKSDNLQVIVNSKKIAKEITKLSKKGHDYATPIPAGTGNSFVLPSANVLKETMNVYNRTDKNGGMKEETSLMEKGKVTQTAQGSEWTNPANKADVQFTFQSSDDTWIHSHPLGVLEDHGTPYYTDESPSSADKSLFPNYDVNVIIGKSGSIGTKQQYLEFGDPRNVVIDFYDKNGTKTGRTSPEALEKINSGDKGSLHKKYERKKSKP